jgi:STE24 endopeptidase
MLTTLFLIFLVTDLGIRLWLANRQINFVRGHRDRVPAAFAERIGLQSHQRAADYTVARKRLTIFEGVFDTIILYALTLGGGLTLIEHWVSSYVSQAFSAQIAFVIAIGLFMGLIGLPFSIYKQFKIEADFGFNRMTPKLFFGDLIKGTLLGAVIGLPLITVILFLMEKAGTAWWLWAWAVWAAFNLLAMWVFPTWIAPLFNKFSPLDDPQLVQRIQALAKRCAFTINGLFVMDGSKRSAHGNAYFTGFGKSRRIVFFDTLLARLTPPEIEAVLAHELGHFKHKHITKRLVTTLVGSLVLFALLGWLSASPWFFSELGVFYNPDAPNHAMALVLFFTVIPVFTFPLTPLMSFLSRRDEFEADQFAMAQANGEDLVSALVKLYDDNASTLTPDPIHSAYYDSHPPASTRIRRLQGA